MRCGKRPTGSFACTFASELRLTGKYKSHVKAELWEKLNYAGRIRYRAFPLVFREVASLLYRVFSYVGFAEVNSGRSTPPHKFLGCFDRDTASHRFALGPRLCSHSLFAGAARAIATGVSALFAISSLACTTGAIASIV